MLYSGTLSWQQVDDIYTFLAHGNNNEVKGDQAGRPMTMGCTGCEEHCAIRALPPQLSINF